MGSFMNSFQMRILQLKLMILRFSETRKTYYDSDGNKLGSSFENQFNEYMDGADRVRTEINYQGPDDQWLGNEYSVTNGERGYSMKRK